MRIAINCRSFLNKKYTGIGRYAYHLVKSLGEIDNQNEYLLYAKKGIFNFSKRLPQFHFNNLQLKIDRFGQGMDKILGPLDIYHSPSPDTLNVNNGAKIVVTVHDLIFKTFPQGHTQRTLDYTEEQFHNIGERASKVICCSQSTIHDLQKYFNVPDEKIKLIYQGVDKKLFYKIGHDENLHATKTIRSKGINEPFLLSVGTIEPRKNLENILHAFDKLKTKGRFRGKLVVIGMKGWLSDGIEGLIRKLELKRHVIFLGYLSDIELRHFYNKAEAFIFPSYYEGFGFPIVEAFSCGTPVITSNISSCPEVAGDAAVLTNPYDPEDIAEGVYHVLDDPKLKDELTDKGFKRAEYFNLSKTAKETLKVYEKVHNASPFQQQVIDKVTEPSQEREPVVK